MIDSHCHLNMISKEKSSVIKIIERAKKEGIDYIVDIGVHPSDLEQRITLLGDIENIYLTAGFYPDYAYSYKDEEINSFKEKIAELNSNKKNIYILGEIGLDYYHNSEDVYKQRDFFEKLISIANELSLPITVHIRDAWDDAIETLTKTRADKCGIIHCFSGGLKQAKAKTFTL